MKKLMLISALLFSGSVWAVDQEAVAYCKHKFKQVTTDIAYQSAGCDFTEKTQNDMKENLRNTYLNCVEYLTDEDRVEINQQSLALSNNMIKKLGKEKACKSNASLYPKQIFN